VFIEDDTASNMIVVV